MTLTREKFLALRPQLLNPLGQAFCMLSEEVKNTLAHEVPPEQIQEMVDTKAWITKREKWIAGSNVLRVNPDWRGPDEPTLPEVDGDLYNPETLAALRNEARIPWGGLDKCPKSWMAAFEKAVGAGARWGLEDGHSWGIETANNFPPVWDARVYKYYQLDPTWTPPPKEEPKPAEVEWVDLPVDEDGQFYDVSKSYEYINIESCPSMRRFMGYVDADGTIWPSIESDVSPIDINGETVGYACPTIKFVRFRK